MSLDMKNIVKKIGKLETTLKNKIESGALFNEMKSFAGGQTKSLRQKVKSSKDAKKVMRFIDQRKKQVEKMAKALPKDMNNWKKYISSQRKELEKIGNQLLKQAKEGKLNSKSLRSTLKSVSRKKATSSRRKTSTRKTTTTRAKAKRK